MIAAPATRQNLAEAVYDQLSAMVTDPARSVGDKLPPIRALSDQLETSVPTLQRAMARLEEEGLLERRHGSGTFIAAQDKPLQIGQSVVFCMNARDNLFGQIAAELISQLQRRGRFATLIDSRQPDAAQLLRGMSQTPISCLVVHGQMHMPFGVFDDPRFRRKPIIGLVDWECPTEIQDLTRVTCDYAAGTRMLTDHLWELGHRKILVVGTKNQIMYTKRVNGLISPLPYSLVTEWRSRGGKLELLGSDHNLDIPDFDAGTLLGIFQQPEPPTAVVALRDPEALVAQRILATHLPQVAERITFTGFYDTTWSSMGQPPITSVNLNLDRVVAETTSRLDALLNGRAVQNLADASIKPRLIVRETSRPASLFTQTGDQP